MQKIHMNVFRDKEHRRPKIIPENKRPLTSEEFLLFRLHHRL